MRPLDLQALSWNDFVANAVFFVIDVALISILTPIIVWQCDQYKWMPARKKLAERSAVYIDRVNSYFDYFQSELVNIVNNISNVRDQYPEVNTSEGIEKLKDLTLQRINRRLTSLENNVEAATKKYLEEMDLLSVSLNSTLSIQVMEFYEASAEPHSIALTYIKSWVLLGIEDPSLIKVDPQIERTYSICENKLLCLCASAKLYAKASGGKIIIGDKYTYGKINKFYPVHPIIYKSMAKIAETMNIASNSLNPST